MKKIVLIHAFLLLAAITYGQQQWQYSQYMNNNFMLNPAEGGTEEFIDIKLGYRTQWVGLDGQPRSFFCSGHSPIKKSYSRFDDVKPLAFHGVGGYISSDKTGPISRTSAYGSYSYHLPLTIKTVASVGVFVGIKQYSLNTSELQFETDEIDNAIQGKQSQAVPDAAIGLWVYNPKYYFGYSSFQLFANKFSFADGVQSATSLSRHHFLTAGYLLNLDDENKLMLIPSIVLKAAFPAPAQLDINAKLRYEDKYWFGVSYRLEDAVVLLAGATFKNMIDVGYSYDINTSNLNNYNSGSHEVMLGLRIHKEAKPVPPQFW